MLHSRPAAQSLPRLSTAAEEARTKSKLRKRLVRAHTKFPSFALVLHISKPSLHPSSLSPLLFCCYMMDSPTPPKEMFCWWCVSAHHCLTPLAFVMPDKHVGRGAQLGNIAYLLHHKAWHCSQRQQRQQGHSRPRAKDRLQGWQLVQELGG